MKKRIMVPSVACISSGIIGASLVNFKKRIYDKFLPTEQHVYMKITHEVQISDTKDTFTNSREALKRLLEKEGHQIHVLKQDLELVNFQNLKHFPQYLTSISHTRGAGASLLALKKDYLALGIDIEWSTRVMKSEARRFFRHPEDSLYQNDLELWTMKEAAFKALATQDYPGVLVLSKIIIQDGIFWSKERPELKGVVECSRQRFDNLELTVSLASIPRSST